MEFLCDILVPENGGKIGDAVFDSLVRHGLNCQRLDDSKVTGDGPGYIRHLKRVVEQVRPRMILPLFKAELIARFRDEFPTEIIIPISSEELIRSLDSKCFTSGLCTELGIEQPRLYRDDEIDSITRYPLVFKRDAGLGGCGVYFPKTYKALSNLVKASGAKGHLVMDYIDGYDICVDAVRWNGYFHAECYRVILPKMKGISFLRRSVCAPELVEKMKMILEKTDYQGICGADFRIDSRTGKAYFLECNPRFSGGLKSQIAAGFDIPYIMWQLCTGQEPDRVNFRKGSFSGEWDELMQWAKTRLKKTFRI